MSIDNQKLRTEAARDRMWADIRQHQDKLHAHNLTSLSCITPDDMWLILKCVAVVDAELTYRAAIAAEDEQ